MKKILVLLICFAAIGAWGQARFKGQDFMNQSEILVQDDKEASSCQAVRIAPKWYLTAAHCVRPQCDKSCMVIVNMLKGGISASVVIRHFSGHERVWSDPNYHMGMARGIRSDIALIFLDAPEEDYFFKLTKQNVEISRAEFEQILAQSENRDIAEKWRSLETGRPKLYTVSKSSNQKVIVPIAVPDLATGRPFVNDGFYYFGRLRHFIGPDMGVRHGVSGSGVVVPGGGIIGVVSAVIGQSDVPVYNEQDQEIGRLAGTYFVFTPLSEFILSKIKSTPNRGELPYVVPIESKVAEQTSLQLQDLFGPFLSEEAILSGRGK